MAFFNSKVSTFELDDNGATLRDISADVNEISGLPGPRQLSEVTALPDTGTKWVSSIENVVITLSGLFSDTAAASGGADFVIGLNRSLSVDLNFEYGPEGNSSGDMMYTGTCLVTDYQITSRVGDSVAWRATLQVQGVVTRAAHA